MINQNEIYSGFLNKGYKILNTLKEHSPGFGKGNYIAEKDNVKYLLKAFSGFKRKHLRAEFEMRQRLKNIQFPGVDFNEFFESNNISYLSIPYIENRGNLEGREKAFSEEINRILLDFHSLPKSLFLDRRGYRIFNKNIFSEDKYPYSFEVLDRITKKHIKKLFLIEVESLEKYEQKPSHNDFNGDNLLLTDSGEILITDFEECSLNFELEDFSRLYFFNALREDSFFENNGIYKKILSVNGNLKPFDLDVFLLYQALRFNEYLGNHQNSITKIPRGEEYKLILERIIDGTFRRNLK